MNVYRFGIKLGNRVMYLSHSPMNSFFYMSKDKMDAEIFFHKSYGLRALQHYCERTKSNWSMSRMVVFREEAPDEYVNA